MCRALGYGGFGVAGSKFRPIVGWGVRGCPRLLHEDAGQPSSLTLSTSYDASYRKAIYFRYSKKNWRLYTVE
jgi:hypothetical protein